MSSVTLWDSYLRLLKGSVLTKVSSTILFLIISNLLTIEEFSIYTIFFASIEILMVIVSLGYPSYILRVQDNQNAIDTLIQSNNFSFINSLLLLVIATISFKISNITSLSYIFLSENLIFFFLILLFKSYINNYRNYYVTSHQSDKILSLDIHCFLVDTALIILILFFKKLNLNYFIGLLVISNFLKFLFFIFKEIKFILKKPFYNFNASPFF
jgi:O-antigen/teichoic acid export membrane protein